MSHISSNPFVLTHADSCTFSYIFPGLGLGAVVAGATSVEDDDFIIAAEILASLVWNVTLHYVVISCHNPIRRCPNANFTV